MPGSELNPSELPFNPEFKLGLALLAPRAAAVNRWMEERRTLKESRLLEFTAAAEASSAGSREALMARCRENEELSDFAESVLRLAVAEASRRKTSALGRLLALGLGEDQQTEIDEAWLMLNAVADLEPPHLRVLRRLKDEGTAGKGILDIELARMFPNGLALMYPLLKTLERHGLAGPLSSTSDPGAAVEWGIWEFGVLVLDRLFPEEARDEG